LRRTFVDPWRGELGCKRREQFNARQDWRGLPPSGSVLLPSSSCRPSRAERILWGRPRPDVAAGAGRGVTML